MAGYVQSPPGLFRRPRVVFVMGVGRSGSTVLDLFLGQHSEVQSVGELCNFVRDGWLGGQPCACERQVPECTFWSQVMELWKKRTQLDVEAYEHLRSRVEHSRRTLWRMLRQVSPERIHLGTQVRGNFLTYAQWTAALYQALSEVSQKPVIVDSSKNPARGLALILMAERLDLIELHLVHLIRDVRGFAWSNKKSFQRDAQAGIPSDIPGLPVWRSALSWNLVNTVAEFARRRHESSRSLLVRYEEFVQSPDSVALQIAGFVAVSPRPWVTLLSSETPLEPGHLVAGNRLRMQRHIRLKPDVEWQTKLTAFEKILVWLLAGWKARAYGYRWRPERNAVSEPSLEPSPGPRGLAGPHFLSQRGISSPKQESASSSSSLDS